MQKLNGFLGDWNKNEVKNSGTTMESLNILVSYYRRK